MKYSTEWDISIPLMGLLLFGVPFLRPPVLYPLAIIDLKISLPGACAVKDKILM